MIDIKSLSKADIGRQLLHTHTNEPGTLAGWDAECIFVRYGTSTEPTAPADLVFYDPPLRPAA